MQRRGGKRHARTTRPTQRRGTPPPASWSSRICRAAKAGRESAPWTASKQGEIRRGTHLLATTLSPSVTQKFMRLGSAPTSSVHALICSIVRSIPSLSTSQPTVGPSSEPAGRNDRNSAKHHSESVDPCGKRNSGSGSAFCSRRLMSEKDEMPPLCIHLGEERSRDAEAAVRVSDARQEVQGGRAGRAHRKPAKAPGVAVLLAERTGRARADVRAEGAAGQSPCCASLSRPTSEAPGGGASRSKTHKISGDRTLSARRRKFSLFQACARSRVSLERLRARGRRKSRRAGTYRRDGVEDARADLLGLAAALALPAVAVLRRLRLGQVVPRAPEAVAVLRGRQGAL